jgi:hypothetical protein
MEGFRGEDSKNEPSQGEFLSLEGDKEQVEISPRKKKWKPTGTVFHIYVATALILSVMTGQFFYMNHQYNGMKQKVMELANSNASAIYSIPTTLSNSLAEAQQEAMNPFELAEWGVSEEGFKNNKFSINFDAMPKVYSETTEVEFQLTMSRGGKLILQGESQNAPHFTAKAEIPFCSWVEAVALLKNGSQIQVKNMGRISLEEEYALQFYGYVLGGYSIEENALIPSEFELVAEVRNPHGKPNTGVNSVLAVVYVNGKEISRLPMALRDQGIWQGDSLSDNETRTYGTRLTEKIPLKAGDKIKFEIEAEDSNGLHYRMEIETWKYDGSQIIPESANNVESIIE